MKIIAVIPARYASTRFPGKPLAELKGKKILQWVVEGARQSKNLDQILVATDDKRIFNFCTSINVDVIMTSAECATGTDRIFQATKDLKFDRVINIQGDEPLISKDFIDPLAEAFKEDASLSMVTLAHPLEAEDLNNKNAVKVITNEKGDAIYFSRFGIPFSRETFITGVVQKHIGLYGFSKDFLGTFCATPQAKIEIAESLEQLRALYLGVRIKVLSVEKPTYGVDTPEDLQKLEALLK